MKKALFQNEPTIINEPGTYTTREGKQVEVEEIRKKYALGKYFHGVGEIWHVCGRILPFDKNNENDVVELPNDIVEKTPTNQE